VLISAPWSVHFPLSRESVVATPMELLRLPWVLIV
jgi:hypothetical protein